MNRLKIAFRVDASLEIGTGHVMRCLTLAHEIRRKGSRVVFVCREHVGHMCDMIFNNGFELVRLGLDHGNNEDSIPKKNIHEKIHDQPVHLPWLGVNQYRDAVQTKEALKKDSPWDWFIVDHYGIDKHWESKIREISNKIMVVDDLADREHECDLLLDQNYFHNPDKRYDGILPEYSKTLFGPNFALLRSDFRQARKFIRMRGNGIARILVYFGGCDRGNLTGMTIEALNSPEFTHLLVDVVVGQDNTFMETLKKQVQKRPGTRLNLQPMAFTELMLRADLCIGAGGTTTWERLCLGLPSIVITVASNQESFTKELDEVDYVHWIGKKDDITVLNLQNSLRDVIRKLENECSSIKPPWPVDGYGALRVLEKLIPSGEQELSVRKTTLDDMEQYFQWVNDREVRANSFQQKIINFEDHISWFNKKIESDQTEMFILQTSQGLPVGQIRFDILGDVANINYSLDPIVRKRGWANILIKSGISEFKKNKQSVVFQGRVKPNNTSSKNAFRRIGFTEVITRQEIIYQLR